MDLKKRLETLRFYEPLGVESVPLVERLLGELLLATESLQKIEGEIKKLQTDNRALTSECEYLAHDKNRVVEELNSLHQKMIAQTVQAHARERQCELTLQKMSDQVKDTRFLNTQLTKNLNEKDGEIEDLKKKNDSIVSKSLLTVKTNSGKTVPLTWTVNKPLYPPASTSTSSIPNSSNSYLLNPYQSNPYLSNPYSSTPCSPSPYSSNQNHVGSYPLFNDPNSAPGNVQPQGYFYSPFPLAHAPEADANKRSYSNARVSDQETHHTPHHSSNSHHSHHHRSSSLYVKPHPKSNKDKNKRSYGDNNSSRNTTFSSSSSSSYDTITSKSPSSPSVSSLSSQSSTSSTSSSDSSSPSSVPTYLDEKKPKKVLKKPEKKDGNGCRRAKEKR